jgi:DNA-binding transcriptional MerR regulator
VRYYEEIGLLSVANRTASGHRVYTHATVEQLRLIRRCRDFGMAIKDIIALIAVSTSPADCGDALALINQHRADLRDRIAELKALERALAVMAARCADTCEGGAPSCCTIYSDLAEPG